MTHKALITCPYGLTRRRGFSISRDLTGRCVLSQLDSKIDQRRIHPSQPSCVRPLATSSVSTTNISSAPIGQRAKQKQADKEFFADLLSSAATRRDAKAYIARLKNPTKLKPTLTSTQNDESKSSVNLGNLFSTPRAIDASPRFAQHKLDERTFRAWETLHIALIKIHDFGSLPDPVVRGIAQTLSQLATLGMAPCVVIETAKGLDSCSRQQLVLQAEKLATALDSADGQGADIIDNAFQLSESGDLKLTMRRLLLRPLREGRVAIIVPAAYSNHDQRVIPLPANDIIVALAEHFSDDGAKPSHSGPRSHEVSKRGVDDVRFSLDRVITIDSAGGIQNTTSPDDKHIFINLTQEYHSITGQLQQRPNNEGVSLQKSNLSLLNSVLQMLPPSSSGLMTTPYQVANLEQAETTSPASMVGTRRQKNMLIYNLLTDKPAISSSLPATRLMKKTVSESAVSIPTFVKLGMPVSIIPNPLVHPWTPVSPRIKLTDPSIDLKKLTHLINDSFNRQLDVEAYLARVNDNIAGIIIAGDYEGGAILTWETPPDNGSSQDVRLVPYLDKFAVLKRSQGSGGVADIVFNAMVRSCFPAGVCWRSRKGNPVNKWYFERSTGTWKIPDMNWTMFWTTPGVASDSQTFLDYERVCRGVNPTWIDKKIAAD